MKGLLILSLKSFAEAAEDEMEDKATFYSLMFLVIGVVAAISFFTMVGMVMSVGQKYQDTTPT